MTDHLEVREQLELAALEPGGLDRLAAGDTPEAAAVAGHLAGCAGCAEEARRLAIVTPILADAIRSMPPDDLRERTLSLVRAVGRTRDAEPVPVEPRPVVPPPVELHPVEAAPVAIASPPPVPVPGPAARRRDRRLAWPLAAAAVLVAFVAGGLLTGIPLAGRAGTAESRAGELTALALATQRLADQADSTRVVLASPDGRATGTLVFSPGSEELVMTASGLTAGGADRVLACWIAGPDGKRTRIGQMSVDGDLAYWAGWSHELGGAGPGTSFGVTLVDGSGQRVGPGDVLTGVVTNG